MTPLTCPACKADLRGDEIPLRWRTDYGGATHFCRAIGIYSTELDRTTHWKCPDCNYEWERK